MLPKCFVWTNAREDKLTILNALIDDTLNSDCNQEETILRKELGLPMYVEAVKFAGDDLYRFTDGGTIRVYLAKLETTYVAEISDVHGAETAFVIPEKVFTRFTSSIKDFENVSAPYDCDDYYLTSHIQNVLLWGARQLLSQGD